MSQVYRVFIRHENESQPTWFKMRSDKTRSELTEELLYAMNQPSPSLWRCTDLEQRSWIFRADKIYSVCVYPAEAEGSESSEHIKIS